MKAAPWSRVMNPEIAEANRRRYKREWMRAKRGSVRRNRPVVASLHELRCTGPTRATGCSCQRIPLYGEPA